MKLKPFDEQPTPVNCSISSPRMGVSPNPELLGGYLLASPHQQEGSFKRQSFVDSFRGNCLITVPKVQKTHENTSKNQIRDYKLPTDPNKLVLPAISTGVKRLRARRLMAPSDISKKVINHSLETSDRKSARRDLNKTLLLSREKANTANNGKLRMKFMQKETFEEDMNEEAIEFHLGRSVNTLESKSGGFFLTRPRHEEAKQDFNDFYLRNPLKSVEKPPIHLMHTVDDTSNGNMEQLIEETPRTVASRFIHEYGARFKLFDSKIADSIRSMNLINSIEPALRDFRKYDPNRTVLHR